MCHTIDDYLYPKIKIDFQQLHPSVESPVLIYLHSALHTRTYHAFTLKTEKPAKTIKIYAAYIQENNTNKVQTHIRHYTMHRTKH